MPPKLPSTWLKLTIHHPPITSEALSQLLFDSGAEGLWEDNPDPAGFLVTHCGFAAGELPRLEKELPELIGRVASAFEISSNDFSFYFTQEDNLNWAEKWKEGLEPIILGPKLAVAPTWWAADDLPKSEIVLLLDPGLAFGSGHHATTCLCLEYLIELAPGAQRILDLGSGSGILALAAAALNPTAYILGIDNDPTTVAVAEENADINNLGHRVKFSVSPEDIKPPFDLLVANITAGILMELAPQISSLAESNSRLILSGLLHFQVDEVLEVFLGLGWVLAQHQKQDEWSGLLLTRAS